MFVFFMFFLSLSRSLFSFGCISSSSLNYVVALKCGVILSSHNRMMKQSHTIYTRLQYKRGKWKFFHVPFTAQRWHAALLSAAKLKKQKREMGKKWKYRSEWNKRRARERETEFLFLSNNREYASSALCCFYTRVDFTWHDFWWFQSIFNFNVTWFFLIRSFQIRCAISHELPVISV